MLKVYIDPVLCLLLKHQSILGAEEVVGSNPVAPASLVFSRLQGVSNGSWIAPFFYHEASRGQAVGANRLARLL